MQSLVKYGGDQHLPHMQTHERVILLFIFIVSFLTYCTSYSSAIFLDGDSPWHIAAGDYIRSLGYVPVFDPWGYTNMGYQWYNLSWAYDVLVSVLHQYGGLKGLIFSHALVAACIPTILARVCFLRGFTIIPILTAATLAILMTDSFFSVRPQLFATLFLALALLELQHFRLAMNKRALLIPLYTLIIANMHGSYLALFIFAGAFWVEFLLQKDKERLKALSLIGILCFMALLINPVGIQIFDAAMRTLGDVKSHSYISEWQPALINTSPHIYIYIIAALAAPLLVSMRLHIADKLLVIFWCVLTIKSARYNAMLLLAITPFIAAFIQAYTQNMKRVTHAENTMFHDFSQPRYATFLAITLPLCVVFTAVAIQTGLIWKKDIYDKEKYPVQEIHYLMQQDKSMRLMNDYDYGGYIIYQAKGSVKPSIDGRAGTAYPSQVFIDNFAMADTSPGWKNLLKKYRINTVMLKKKAPEVAEYLATQDWRVAYSGPVAIILKKNQ